MTGKLALQYLAELKKVINEIPLDGFERLVDAIFLAHQNDNAVYTMGNGGSGATASHLVCDLNKGVCAGLPKRIRAICLNDNVPSILAYANDLSYDMIFVEQLKNFLKPCDVVIAISGSGNSANILAAVEFAHKIGATTVGLTGFDGGKLAAIASIPIVIPVYDMQKAEDVHMVVVHMLTQIMCKKLMEMPARITQVKTSKLANGAKGESRLSAVQP
jgi:D-sedoheptulose 7-phosphate isomerase